MEPGLWYLAVIPQIPNYVPGSHCDMSIPSPSMKRSLRPSVMAQWVRELDDPSSICGTHMVAGGENILLTVLL